MATMKIQVEREEDLTMLEKVLADLGLKYSIEESVQSSDVTLSGEALKGIYAGIEDLEEGRVLSHSEAMERFEFKIAQLRVNHAG